MVCDKRSCAEEGSRSNADEVERELIEWLNFFSALIREEAKRELAKLM
jgi:hypothetical protein